MLTSPLETSHHLFQRPFYKSSEGKWTENYLEACRQSEHLNLDIGSLVSCLSFGYAAADRTLFSEISRQPWMSEIMEDQSVVLSDIAPHDFYQAKPKEIAANLLRLLENEAETVCKGRDNVYILTSGGMDSRIVAGVVRKLKDEGRITSKVTAVTWGQKESRDVEIGKFVANKLNFPWLDVELGAEHMLENVETGAEILGALISPVNLHRMTWFRDLPENSLVLGGSYGDSVGRSEFSGRIILALAPLKANNPYGLLKKDAFEEGSRLLKEDFIDYRKRMGSRPEYAKQECEYQAHYMRSVIAQTMSVINNSTRTTLYQMFTAPEVYSYMWSIHPSDRDDRPYMRVLEMLGNDLDKIPWARTNKPISGNKGITIEAKNKRYQEYPRWMKNHVLPLLDKNQIKEDLHKTGVFDVNGIDSLFDNIAQHDKVTRTVRLSTNILCWLLSTVSLLDKVDGKIEYPEPGPIIENKISREAEQSVSSMRRTLREVPILLKNIQKFRKYRVRKQARITYPGKKRVEP